jgi:hypothetical protein
LRAGQHERAWSGILTSIDVGHVAYTLDLLESPREEESRLLAECSDGIPQIVCREEVGNDMDRIRIDAGCDRDAAGECARSYVGVDLPIAASHSRRARLDCGEQARGPRTLYAAMQKDILHRSGRAEIAWRPVPVQDICWTPDLVVMHGQDAWDGPPGQLVDD